MRILHRYKKNPCNVQYSIDGGGIEYGLLYNWYAAIGDPNGDEVSETSITSSDDWMLPSVTDFSELREYLGGADVAGGKLKEKGIEYWTSPNVGATNNVHFNGRGSGNRGYNSGLFSSSIKNAGFYWTSSTYLDDVWIFILRYDNDNLTQNPYDKNNGTSIRLFREATVAEQLLADGTACEPYTGNDGKSYQTVKIGTQVWLAENLAETKYRNGDIIPEVTDNTEWSNLTTGALCAYKNDWNYVGTTLETDTINYTLISGELPITVELIGSTTYTNNHIILESGSFTDIPGGTYTFKVTDTLGCEESEIIEIPYSEPIALNSSYDIDRKTLETCTVFKGFDYTVFGFTGETMFDRVKITSVPTNGTLSRGLLDTILVNDELIYPSDFNNGLYYRTSSIEKVDYSDTIGFQVRVNGLWSNTATITINVNSCIFADDCIEYGYLYNWYAATDARKITSSDDWVVLCIGNENGDYHLTEGDLIPLSNEVGWGHPEDYYTRYDNFGKLASFGAGINLFNFDFRAAGMRSSNGEFSSIASHIAMLLGRSGSMEGIPDNTNVARFSNSGSFSILGDEYQTKKYGGSIRLVRPATTEELLLANGTYCTPYSGNNGIQYKTVKIGTQVWMAENLAETQYRNGDPIPTVEDNATWAGLTTGAKCAYDNNYEYVGCDEPQEPSGWCTLADAEYDGINLVHTGYSYTYGTFMSENGTKFFVTDYSSATILEYTLSTPFNISSATLSYAFSTSSQETSPSDVFWGDDGDYCFISGYHSDKITKYTVTTPYDLSTATYDSQSGNVMPPGTTLPSLSGVAFNGDGTRMFISVHSQYSGSGIYEYTTSSPYNLTGLTLTDNKFTSFGVTNTFEFTNNGNYLYVASQGGMVSFIKLTEPYSLSGYERENVDFPPDSGMSQRTGITISSDGKKMYLTDNINNETRQYTLCP